MLQNSDPAPTTAAETRVSTHALTEALASIDARKTREAFARVGTVTLAKGLQDTGVEATPAEVYAEIETLREADAAQEGVKRRQRRLKLVLKAEVVSALLCFLVLFGFQRTLYNPAWQQARQATLSPALPQSNPSLVTPSLTAFRPQPEEFKRLLGLTTGPDPQYIIHAVHQFSYYTGIPEGTMPRVEASADRPLYPLYWLPDGIAIHEDGKFSDEYALSLLGPSKTWIEFIDKNTARHRFDTLTVYHNGATYSRGWIMKSDVPRVLGGHSFMLYPFTVMDPAAANPNMVSLTVSKSSIVEAHPKQAWPSAETYYFIFSEGQKLPLDAHAWEYHQNVPGKS